jgi:GT2 family glycosyltransferase
MVLFANSGDEVERAIEAAIFSARSAGVDIQIALGSNSPRKKLNMEYQKIVKRFSRETDIELFISPTNLGHGAMHNALFFENAIPSDFLLLLNPDGLLGPQTISQMISKALPKSVGAVEPRQLPLEHPKAYDIFTGETNWASGACLLVKSEVFARIGGFDTRFFLHGDDVDLSWRIRNEGLKLIYSVDSVFFHDKKISRNGFPMVSESERFFGPLGALLIAHKYNLSKGLKYMISDLKNSNDPIHKKILATFDILSAIHEPVKIKYEIPKYFHPWKFSKTRF